MSIPFGPWLVAALGIVVIAVGLVMFYRAWTGDVDRWLNLTELPPTIRAIVRASGGSVSWRGVSCSVSPAYFSFSRIQLRPEDARGLGGTLRTIRYQHEGRLLLGIIALGFISTASGARGFRPGPRFRYHGGSPCPDDKPALQVIPESRHRARTCSRMPWR